MIEITTALTSNMTHFSDVFDNDLFIILIQVAAYITPYFLIPATFKFGLGVFGNLAGMINDRGRGFFDKQRKFRGGQKEKYRQRALEGNRFAGRGFIRDRANRGIANSMNAPGAILDSGTMLKPGMRGQNWRAATRTKATSRNQEAVERNMKENAAYQPWMHNDGLNRAATESDNIDELRSNIHKYTGATIGSKQNEDMVSQVETVRRSMGSDAFKQMTALQAIAGGTAYDGSGEVANAIASATGRDDSARAYMVAKARSAAMGAGRVDHGGMGFGDLYGQAGLLAQKGKNVTTADIQASTDFLNEKVFEGQGGATLVHSSMKPTAIKQMAKPAVGAVEAAINSGDDRVAIQRLASIAATQDGLAGSSPQKAAIWADTVMSKEINVADLSPDMRKALSSVIDIPDEAAPVQRQESSGSITGAGAGGASATSSTTQVYNEQPRIKGSREKITYQQAIEALRNKPEFNEMRREYGSGGQEAMAGSRPGPGGPSTGAPTSPTTSP